jgi:D-alanine-D-alanine ligase
MKKNILLLFGGRSSEHEVSVQSAKNIFKAIDANLFSTVLVAISKQGTWFVTYPDQFEKMTAINDQDHSTENSVVLTSQYSEVFLLGINSKFKLKIDCAFPIIHGTNGEDGSLQGYLKLMNVPFVGCDVLSSAVCMDKEYMKIILTSAGISNSKYLVLKKNTRPDYEHIVQHLGSPFFIKPANAGSSVGVHKVKNKSDFESQIKDSFLYDHKVIAEEFIQGRELECSVMGLNQKPTASLPGELIVKHEFYSYEAKYLDANGAEIIIPAQLEPSQMIDIQNLAVRAYEALGCDGLARIDFFLRFDGQIYINELNTLPGFTKISMYPKMWEATGLKYSELITQLIHLSFEKFNYDSQKKQNYL